MAFIDDLKKSWYDYGYNIGRNGHPNYHKDDDKTYRGVIIKNAFKDGYKDGKAASKSVK